MTGIFGTVEDLERAGIVVLERGWLSSNSVILHGDGHHGAVLLDTGYWTHSAQTVELVRHRLGGEPLVRVLNTHLHSDHCGGNAAVQAAFGCPIDVPAGEAHAVDAWDMSQLSYQATGQYCPRFSRAGVLDAPSVVRAGRWDWVVLAAPGHDPRSVALYQRDLGVLVSADALWEDGFGVVFPELAGEPGFADVRATLASFADLPVRWVIPGHGRPFTDFAHALDRARRRLDAFEADPQRHATHAAKVLIKFRLLETQAESWESFLAWVGGTPYFELLRQRYFEGCEPMAWVRTLVGAMCDRGALAEIPGGIANA